MIIIKKIYKINKKQPEDKLMNYIEPIMIKSKILQRNIKNKFIN